MTTEAIREKLHDLINTVDDKHVMAVSSIFEDKIEERYDHWEDEEFLKEIKTRLDDFESGKTQGIPWEEVRLKVRNKMKNKG